MNNAAKYTEESGRIWLTAHRDGDEAVVSVRDSGIGIPPDVLPRVFELFAQDDRALDRSQGGLGIGLTMVRTLVEMHGGSVQAISDGPGRGSEFVVRMPTLPSHIPHQPPRSPAPSRPTTAAAHRILIVDDNVDSAESLALLLNISGHNVRTAHDGQMAVQAAREHQPDMVLLDIGLPRMDGYAVARHLRRDAELPSMTLIAMTGYGQDEDRRKTREAGFDYHLVKPVDPSDLATLLAQPIRR